MQAIQNEIQAIPQKGLSVLFDDKLSRDSMAQMLFRYGNENTRYGCQCYANTRYKN